MLREAVEGRRNSSFFKSARFASAASALGACLVAQERFEEAESFLLESQATLAELGSEPAATSKAVQRLVELYEALNRPEGEQRWREQVVETK